MSIAPLSPANIPSPREACLELGVSEFAHKGDLETARLQKMASICQGNHSPQEIERKLRTLNAAVLKLKQNKRDFLENLTPDNPAYVPTEEKNFVEGLQRRTCDFNAGVDRETEAYEIIRVINGCETELMRESVISYLIDNISFAWNAIDPQSAPLYEKLRKTGWAKFYAKAVPLHIAEANRNPKAAPLHLQALETYIMDEKKAGRIGTADRIREEMKNGLKPRRIGNAIYCHFPQHAPVETPSPSPDPIADRPDFRTKLLKFIPTTKLASLNM